MVVLNFQYMTYFLTSTVSSGKVMHTLCSHHQSLVKMLDIPHCSFYLCLQAECKSPGLTFQEIVCRRGTAAWAYFFSLFDDCVSQTGPEATPRGMMGLLTWLWRHIPVLWKRIHIVWQIFSLIKLCCLSWANLVSFTSSFFSGRLGLGSFPGVKAKQTDQW